jgi:hypothetical protein
MVATVSQQFAASLVAAAAKAAVDGGATRHVAAAVTTAAVRTVWQLMAGESEGDEEHLDSFTQAGLEQVQQELAARLRAVKPVILEHIVAAASGRAPAVPGDARVKRNVAVHVGFGEGAGLLSQPAQELRRRQRGRRRPRGSGSGTGLVPASCSSEPVGGSSHCSSSSSSSSHEKEGLAAKVLQLEESISMALKACGSQADKQHCGDSCSGSASIEKDEASEVAADEVALQGQAEEAEAAALAEDETKEAEAAAERAAAREHVLEAEAIAAAEAAKLAAEIAMLENTLLYLDDDDTRAFFLSKIDELRNRSESP